ncbi:sll1863 family stress response protein [Thiocapsa marina]|uniref:Uncharacterized protein n=1 Tax=Thiocapsa marina 5811 TaxID=768671 RepID=F9U9J2_9GAMM|nr:hypothetical protein [Thiocapsa marina]EGV19450.1 hypothetical protein ThimaDRAFT_1594 [Thiocapsa marina 5811]
MLTKDEFIADMKTRIDAWNAEIDVLQEKAHDIKEDAKVKYEEQLLSVRAAGVEGEKRLEEMQAATESNWEQLKLETERAWDAFKDSFNTFKSHYR